MHVYFSGIGGVAIGPLARIARDCGHEVTGSNDTPSRYTEQFDNEPGITISIGQSRDSISQVHQSKPIDWFVYTSSLPTDHEELAFCQENNIKTTKRHDFINHILSEKKLKMLAVAGTHGKTNTTGLLVWIFQQLNIPASYSVGSNISFGANGAYQANSNYFIYEADEFDKNFLNFHPEASIITSFDYDHPDTYPEQADYDKAFQDFAKQSNSLFTWQSIAEKLKINESAHSFEQNKVDTASILLPGQHTRENAFLAMQMVKNLLPDTDPKEIAAAVNSYPGTERRLEKLSPSLYTDYAHHPVEIAATIQAALEINPEVCVVYQPHQNLRQHEIIDQYKDSFNGANKIYWLPTFLSREPKDVKILMPHELISHVSNSELIEVAAMNEKLWQQIQSHLANGELVLCLSAGDLDAWIRSQL